MDAGWEMGKKKWWYFGTFQHLFSAEKSHTMEWRISWKHSVLITGRSTLHHWESHIAGPPRCSMTQLRWRKLQLLKDARHDNVWIIIKVIALISSTFVWLSPSFPANECTLHFTSSTECVGFAGSIKVMPPDLPNKLCLLTSARRS